MLEKISRRDFIKKSAIGVAAGSAVLSGIDFTKLAAQSGYGKTLRLSGGDVVVKLSDEKNKPLEKVCGAVLLDDDNILVRLSETQFLGVNLICTHKGCTVEYFENKFVCPCHGSEYDKEGKVLEGPAKTNLKTYETVYDDKANTVTVKMGKKEEKK